MSDLININVKIEGLDEEIKDEIAKINKQIPIALNQVGSEMILDLQRHIHEDWYNPWKPTVYHRRTDDSSLGIPLGDDKNITAYVDKFTKSLGFIYAPTGWHEEGRLHNGWYRRGDGIRRDGDELIESIQTGRLAGSPPPRPFWNNFVEEQKNEKIMQTFTRGMLPYNLVLEGEQDLQFDGNESMLEAENVQLKKK